MKRKPLVLIICLLHSVTHAAMPPGYDERLADAIYKAENSKRYPYGIITKRQLTEVEARRWCINTIRHRHRDWERAGRKGQFLDYLGAIYCPVGAANDPTGLNVNWVRNVKALLTTPKP